MAERFDIKQVVYSATIPAKVNLSLVITGRRDGMHTIDSIVYPYRRYFDVVNFVPDIKDKPAVKVKVKEAYFGFNKKRFEAFFQPIADKIAQHLDASGTLEIKKGIPLGAGLGGSSACIVGAIKTMSEYLKRVGKSARIDVEFLLSLGSDVPVMYKGGVNRVRGIGEIVTPVDDDYIPDFDVKIAPGGSDSGDCYRLYDAISKIDDVGYIPATVREAVGLARNDLTEAAESLNPEIAKLRKQMLNTYDAVVMTGSGSGLIGIKNRDAIGI